MAKLQLLFFLFGMAFAKNIHIKSMQNCEGFEEADLIVIKSTMPEEVEIPSTVTFDLHARQNADTPADLVMMLNLQKQDPFPLDVPCLDGLGSCEYDICKTITDVLADTVCPQFPENQPCGCPLLKGELDLHDIKLEVPDFGPILGELMQGSYKAKAELYGKSNPDKIVGCMDMTFTFLHNN